MKQREKAEDIEHGDLIEFLKSTIWIDICDPEFAPVFKAMAGSLASVNDEHVHGPVIAAGFDTDSRVRVVGYYEDRPGTEHHGIQAFKYQPFASPDFRVMESTLQTMMNMGYVQVFVCPEDE